MMTWRKCSYGDHSGWCDDARLPNVVCEDCALAEHREPIDGDAVLVVDAKIDLAEVILDVRDRLNSDSPDWLRTLYEGLCRMQNRLQAR
jgi:hypothetical protein